MSGRTVTDGASRESGLVLPIPSRFSDLEFSRLYNAVRPNKLSTAAFRSVVLSGQSDSHYNCYEMQKLASAAREILMEGGRVAEGAGARWRGKKSDIARELRAVTMVVSEAVSGASPALHSRHTTVPVCAPGLLADFTTDCFFPNASNLRSQRAAMSQSTVPSLVSGTLEGVGESGMIPKPTLARNPVMFSAPEEVVPKSSVCPAVASDLYAAPPPSTVPPLVSFWSSVAALCDGGLCIKGYQPYCSPLLPIVAELKRITVRAGCAHSNFDVPSEHMNGVVERRRRVLVVPLQGGYQPSVWPKDAKDLYIYVNGTHCAQRWKRQWPRPNLQTSYLPVDITQYIDRRRQVQTLQFTSGDFPLNVAVVVAYQVSEIDLAEALGKSFTRSNALAIMYRQMAGEEVRTGEEDDDVVEATASTMSTVCPISRGRLSIPVRGANCKHMQPIDLAPYLRTAHTGCYWNCPKCDEPMRGEDIIVDNVLMSAMRDLVIPRTWEHIQVQRKPGVPVAEAPLGSLLAASHYQWLRWCKDTGINDIGSETSSDGGGEVPPSQDGGGVLGSASQTMVAGSSRAVHPSNRPRAEVISLDD